MQKSFYFRVSLFTPLLILVLAPPFGWLVLAVAGLPYASFALALFFWTKRRSERTIWRVSLLAPIMFFPILYVYWIVMFGVADHGLAGMFELALVLLAYSVVMGYGFVGIIHMGAALMYGTSGSNKNKQVDL